MVVKVNNTFDINHVFVVSVGSKTAYIPFRNVSHLLDSKSTIEVVMRNGDVMAIDAEYFLQEYKSCVGLPLDGE